MKKFICAVLALVMVLSLAACGSKQDDNSGKTDVDLTAQEVLDKLKETLGDSYGCDAQDDEDRMTNYYGLDMSQVDSWASEASSMSALDPSTAVVLKVKDGYADTAADLLRERYQRVLDYSKMYNMNVPMVEQARLFVSGNYVALLILGQTPDGDVTAELARLLVGLEHDCSGVPADGRMNVPLDLAVAGVRRLFIGRDRIDVGRLCGERKLRTGAPRRLHCQGRRCAHRDHHREPGSRGLLDDLEARATAHEQAERRGGEPAVEQETAHHLVDGVVAADVFAHLDRVTGLVERRRAVDAAAGGSCDA